MVMKIENGWDCGEQQYNFLYHNYNNSIVLLFYYLISNEVSHPVDMHLYVYTTTATTADGENYQNLLGINGLIHMMKITKLI